MSLLVKPKLLILDKMGYLSLDSFGATCLFQLVLPSSWPTTRATATGAQSSPTTSSRRLSSTVCSITPPRSTSRARANGSRTRIRPASSLPGSPARTASSLPDGPVGRCGSELRPPPLPTPPRPPHTKEFSTGAKRGIFRFIGIFGDTCFEAGLRIEDRQLWCFSASPPMRGSALLPDVSELELVCLRQQDGAIQMELRTAGTSAVCPDCHTPSRRVHSRYLRKLADLPWQGIPVVLQLQSRRFFCLDLACPRRVFTNGCPTPLRAMRGERSYRSQRWTGLRWQRVERQLLDWRGVSDGRSVAARCCASFAEGTLSVAPRRCQESWASTIGHGAKAIATERYFAIWKLVALSICCPTEPRRQWRSGCGPIPAWRLSAAIAPARMPRPPARERPVPSRWPTGGICCAA